ncbi:MAG: hypothetical protein GXO89_03650 [Chlorobi bacterium]|nr:hypothetical protein [Chlorobiota bacterium]
MTRRISFLLAVLPFFAFSQSSSLKVEKDEKSYIFAQIFTDFQYGMKDTFKPRASFRFNQGIIGYKHTFSDELSGIIMYDVTRTTHFYGEADSAGNKPDFFYFEGSKYTSYLKMAEIKWRVNDFFTFRVGQLLSTQYLTFQDRFWGFRYVDVTMQEKFRMGMPADFGAQLDFRYGKKFLNQFSVVNGEGPFRYQDMNSKFLFSNNIQFNPIEKITLKLYTAYEPASDTGLDVSDKVTISAFAGYKIEKYRLGAEYNYISNYAFKHGDEYHGISVYGSWTLNGKIVFLGRFDHLYRVLATENKYVDYYIVGFQYEPVKTFTTSINFRYYSVESLPFVYASFGLKF